MQCNKRFATTKAACPPRWLFKLHGGVQISAQTVGKQMFGPGKGARSFVPVTMTLLRAPLRCLKQLALKNIARMDDQFANHASPT